MKIRYQLMLLLLATGIVLTIPADLYQFSFVKDIITEMMHNQLESISETKEIRIQDMVNMKLNLAKALAEDLKVLTNPDNGRLCTSKTCLNETRKALTRYRERMHPIFQAITLTDVNGKILLSTDSSDPEDFFKTDKDFISDILITGKAFGHTRREHGKLIVTVACKIDTKKGPASILFLDAFAEDFLTLTSNYTGLGETGETYIAKSKGGKTMMISPVRFYRDASLEMKLPQTDTNISINKPLLFKRDGFCTDCIDYRGIKVISSYRYIKDLDWGMVTEIDQAELMEPVNRVKQHFLIILIVSLLFLMLLAFYISGYFSRPIEKLKAVVRDFTGGNYKSRADIKLENEIGDLSESFNVMANTIEKNITLLNLSNQSLNKFGYVISHDLKAPVQSIHALTNLIQADYKEKLDRDGIEMLEMIEEKCIQMEQMISDVLKAAKSGHQGKENKELLDPERIILSAIHNLTIPAHITIKHADNFPSVNYNKTSLLQVFQNLISNAVKYNHKQSGFIQIGWEDYQDKYLFYVKDNGRGISESDYNKIFNIFAATDTNLQADSSGIGLSTIKKIITENGGEIWVTSEINKGSTFYFTIPKVKENE